MLSTCALIPHRSLISLTGAHATHFLNGILTLGPPVPAKGGFFTAFLHAQGRVLYDAFVYRKPGAEDEYLIEYDPRPSAAPPLASLLKRYVLRSKVKIRDVSDEWDVWGAWGADVEQDDRKWRWGPSGAVEPIWHPLNWPWGGKDDTSGISIDDRRAHGMGKRMLLRKGEIPSESANHGIVPSEAYTIHRMLHGVPEGTVEIPPMQAFPMESNLDVMGALDFRKGCYVGQELTVRTYFTGVIRKRIFPVKLHPPAKPSASLENEAQDMWRTAPPPVLAPGLDIRPVAVTTPDGKIPRLRGTGKLLNSVGNVGLALLRLEHVESVSQGLANFEMEIGGEERVKQSWQVTHSWPPGWPIRGVDEIDPALEYIQE